MILLILTRTSGSCRLDLRQLQIHPGILKQMAQIGIPAGLQSSMYCVANMLIQSTVNSFGATVMAGNTAADNIVSLLGILPVSFRSAAVSFTSQNYGGRKYDRISRVKWICLACGCGTGLLLGGIGYLLRESLLALYTTDSQAIEYGLIRMRVMCPLLFLTGLNETCCGYHRGLGYSKTSLAVTILGMGIGRIGTLYTLFARYPTYGVLCTCFPISWGVTFLMHFACTSFEIRYLKKQSENKNAAPVNLTISPGHQS